MELSRIVFGLIMICLVLVLIPTTSASTYMDPESTAGRYLFSMKFASPNKNHKKITKLNHHQTTKFSATKIILMKKNLTIWKF